MRRRRGLFIIIYSLMSYLIDKIDRLDRQADSQTDRKTDRQTDRQTDRPDQTRPTDR